jgi:hypothetical protein
MHALRGGRRGGMLTVASWAVLLDELGIPERLAGNGALQ